MEDEGWSCFRKVRYDSEQRAERYRRKREQEGAEPLRVYFCDICGGYHLTKVSQPSVTGKST